MLRGMDDRFHRDCDRKKLLHRRCIRLSRLRRFISTRQPPNPSGRRPSAPHTKLPARPRRGSPGTPPRVVIPSGRHHNRSGYPARLPGPGSTGPWSCCLSLRPIPGWAGSVSEGVKRSRPVLLCGACSGGDSQSGKDIRKASSRHQIDVRQICTLRSEFDNSDQSTGSY